MRSMILFVLLGCSFAQAAELTSIKPESVGMSSERLTRIKPSMQAYVDKQQLAGVVTLVARRGKIVHFEEVGLLDLNRAEPLRRDSLFRIYSMTKPIVSAAAMLLYEEGKFQLTDSVAQYLPEFKDAKVWVDGELVEQNHAFTIRELMSHTAGLTYGFGETTVNLKYREALFKDDFLAFKQATLGEMVGEMGKLPLSYQPGTRWVYSLSADVLGRLIEVVSGLPLDEFLDTRMFTPLGMNDTFFSVPTNKLARFGTNHEHNKDGKLIAVETPEDSGFTGDVTFFSGGHGLVSTAMDYLKFSQMMLNGGRFNGVQLLGRKTIALMVTNQLAAVAMPDLDAWFDKRSSADESIGFGLGFSVTMADLKAVPGSVGEYSWGGAAGTVFWIDPEEELVAVLMVQTMSSSPSTQVLRTQFKVLVEQAIIE